MLEAIASALRLLMDPCYALTQNWWAAIALFTLATKVILMPLSLWCQKNYLVMVRLMPDLNRIKVAHYGDRETIGEKQSALYKEKNYHPLLSLVPLAIQIIILLGLIDVIHSVAESGAPGTELLGLIPMRDGGASWAMPVLAGASAVALSFAQNRINPLQREQTRAEKNLTNGVSIALSLCLGVFVAAGMAFYWACSNLFSIAVQAACNLIIDPRKHIDYDDLRKSQSELEAVEQFASTGRKWWQRDPLAKRERADCKRFASITGKHLVYYSEGSGFYKYYRGQIEWLLAHSNVTVHYLTSDPDDQVFAIAQTHPRILPYFVREKKLIPLLMRMDADVVVLSTNCLDVYYLKRSYVRKDIQYVFAPHHMSSLHMVCWKDSFIHYDVILCSGPHMVREMEAEERIRGLERIKDKPQIGYPLLDEMIADYERDIAGSAPSESRRKSVVIGPSWAEDNILDSCIDELLESLLGNGWSITVRPHPEYTKRWAGRWKALQERWKQVPEDELCFEQDFSSNRTVYAADVLITDWSSVAFDFSYSTGKPSLFVDTKMKVQNPDYEELGCPPTDITWRDELGRRISPKEAGRAAEPVRAMLEDAQSWRNRIEEARSRNIFNIGSSASAAGAYILDLLEEREAIRKGLLDPREARLGSRFAS